MKGIKKLLLIVLLLLLIFISCRKKHPNDYYYDGVSCNEPDDSLNTYSLKIGSILTTNCVSSGCHNSSSHKKKIDLEGYTNSVSSFNDKPILCAIYQDKGCKSMPKGGSKLSDDVIHDITCWAKNGFPN